MNESRTTKILLLGVGMLIPMLAARAARGAAGRGYHALTSSEPPKNPAHPDVEWKEAMIWTLAMGAAGGLARLFARRWLAGTSIPAQGFNFKKEAEDADLG